MAGFFGVSAPGTGLGAEDVPTIQVLAADGDIEAVRLALERDPAVCHSQDEHGHSALAAAASYGHLDVMRLLLDSGASATMADNDGDTPLHVCSTADCAELLLESAGHNLLLVRNEDGKTALENHQEELDEARMQALGEQMVTLNGNAATAEMDAMMQELSQETSAEVERLQAIVELLSRHPAPEKQDSQNEGEGLNPSPQEGGKDNEKVPPPSP